jgi:hypothetical protein
LIHQISTSEVARITGMSHWCPADPECSLLYLYSREWEMYTYE